MLNSIQHFVENGIPQLEKHQNNFMQDPHRLDQFVKQLMLELGCCIISEALEEERDSGTAEGKRRKHRK